MKDFLQKMYADAEELNTSNVKEALSSTRPHVNLLDVGCGDGENTKIWAEAAGAKNVFGIEAVGEAAKKAKKNKVIAFTSKADTGKWPIPNASIDCVVSNQVIEHLNNVDHYFEESHRVLKRGGYIVTSTNNLSSVHNILSIILGWAPFDLSNSSYKKIGIGNPLALHKGETTYRGNTWVHKCIYTSKWLVEWQALYGLKHIKTYGAGLFPLPAIFGRIYPVHSAFITIVTQKQK